MGHTNKEGY